MAGRDNWFENAAKEAEAMDIALEARERKERLIRNQVRLDRERAEHAERLRRITPAPRPGEAKAAAAIFEAVADGSLPITAGVSTSWGGSYSSGGPIGTARPPRSQVVGSTNWNPPPGWKPTANEGLTAIIDAVRNAGDADAVLRAAGEWITKVTNGITEVVKEADDQ